MFVIVMLRQDFVSNQRIAHPSKIVQGETEDEIGMDDVSKTPQGSMEKKQVVFSNMNTVFSCNQLSVALTCNAEIYPVRATRRPVTQNTQSNTYNTWPQHVRHFRPTKSTGHINQGTDTLIQIYWTCLEQRRKNTTTVIGFFPSIV